VPAPDVTTTAPFHTTTATTTSVTTAALKPTLQIAMGLLRGLLSDTDDIDICVQDGTSSVDFLIDAVKDIRARKVRALVDLLEALEKLQPLSTDCAPIRNNVQKLINAVQGVSWAKAKANLKAHGADINAALEAAADCQDASDFSGMGKQLGIALRKLFEEDGIVVV